MVRNEETGGRRRGSRWRIIAWTAAAFMLLLPLLAMQVTDQVDWDTADFAVFGALLVGAGGAYELTVRMRDDAAYRSAVGVALTAAFLLIWLSLGVGIIGTDGDPANLLYFGVLAVGIVGALIARFRPRGMARALFATAFAQASVAVIAVIAGLGYKWSGPLGVLVLNGFFVGLFVGSAWLFRKVAHGGVEQGDD